MCCALAQFPADFESIGVHDLNHKNVVWKRPKVCVCVPLPARQTQTLTSFMYFLL